MNPASPPQADDAPAPISVPPDHVLGPDTAIRELLTIAAPGSRAHDITVVGDTGIDLMVRVEGLPGRDEKAIGEHLGIFGGGMGANFATAATRARPDLEVAFVSRVGSDAFGQQCLADLQSEGVDTRYVHIEPDGITWWCAVALDATGEKALLGGRTSASLPERTDLPEGLLAQTRWVHMLGDIPFSAELVELARAHGALSSVDIEGSFVDADPARAGWLAASADLVVINASGLRALTHRDDPIDAGLHLLRSGPSTGPRMLVITLGARGALVLHRDAHGRWQAHAQPAIPVDVVDSTGAGDSFAGTFVAGLVAGDPIGTTTARAAQAAATTLGALGSRGRPLPTIRPTTGGTT